MNAVLPALLMAIQAPMIGQVPLTGQATPPKPQPTAPVDAEPDDIVVEGYRSRPDLDTTVAPPTAVSGRISRTKYEFSERIAKCAARSKLADLDRLRAVVDGDVNTATYHTAQDRLVRIYITCSESPSLLSFTTPPQSTLDLAIGSFEGPNPNAGVGGQTAAAPLGWSIYDRGAFTIQALKFFAPDLKLTRKETGDPKVQSRFNLREVPRNRWRLRSDFRYFETAVCMVRVEPRLAVRLAMSDGPARLGDMQAALIDRARICVGRARNVRVDPTQFRLYIADAVYRWAVAARGVDSLIPATTAQISPAAGTSPS